MSQPTAERRPFESMQRRYRIALGLFAASLVLSGLTAFPLLVEVRWLCDLLGVSHTATSDQSWGLVRWLALVREGAGGITPDLSVSGLWHRLARLWPSLHRGVFCAAVFQATGE